MGAVLGLAAYGRTQEKLAGANNGGIQLPSGVGTTYTPPAPIQQPAASGFSTPAVTPSAAPAVITGFGGKPGPVQPSFSAI